MKKIVSIIVSVTILIGMTGIAGAAATIERPTFKDTANHWAKAQIEEAARKGYVDGFPDGTFKPDIPVTRAQFIKMIVTALGLDYTPEGSVWYETYAQAAKVAGIYQEKDFDANKMNDKLVREHMAWLAVRAADDRLHTVESSGITKEAKTDHWPMSATDNVITRTDAEMLDYYRGFLTSEAFKKGILLGYGGNEIGLERTTTRAQTVTVIERILSLRDGKKLQTDKYAIAESELKWLKTNLFIVAPHIFDDQGEVVSDMGLGMTEKTKNSMKLGWKKENLVLKDAYFHAEVNQIILVNLGDSKDPNRKLLPAVANIGVGFSEMGTVPKDAFVAIVNYEVYENKMPSIYNGLLYLQFSGYLEDYSKPVSRARMLYTNSNPFNHLNNSMFDDSRKPIGKHTMAFIIPNTGYTLEKRYDRLGNRVNDNLGRQLIVSLQPLMAPGTTGGVDSTFLYGKTTHYDK